MPIPINYRKSSEPSLVNYDWTDVSEGTGIKVYYGTEIAGTATRVYQLQGNQSVNSARTSTSYNLTTQSAFTKVLDLDFDTTFNMPKNIKGKIISSTPFGIWVKVDKAYQQFLTMNVYKWNGTTETFLCSGSSYQYDGGEYISAVGYFSRVMCVPATCSLTHFKKGETLRVNMCVYGKCVTGDGDAYMGIGHDPADRDDFAKNGGVVDGLFAAGQTTQMQVFVPFVLDI